MTRGRPAGAGGSGIRRLSAQGLRGAAPPIGKKVNQNGILVKWHIRCILYQRWDAETQLHD